MDVEYDVDWTSLEQLVKGLAQLAVSCLRGSMCLMWVWKLFVKWKWI